MKKIANMFFVAAMSQLLLAACAPSATDIEAERSARVNSARQRIEEGSRNSDPYSMKGIYNRE
jgi:hypothetical protein